MEGCCVCADDSGTEENPLVYCDGSNCNVCVHKACYGIASIPTGDWFCSRCAHVQKVKENRSKNGANNEETNNANADAKENLRCLLCPSTEGAFKPTEGGKWAHVVCALYIKEVEFGDTETMEPIVTASIPKDRFQQACYICAEEGATNDAVMGACSVCEKSSCKKAFHVTCAQRKGLLCEITRKNSSKTVVYSGYCADHIPALESGVQDGNRYRKIAPYPRSQPMEQSSSSSGYSTPNNPEKTPPPNGSGNLNGAVGNCATGENSQVSGNINPSSGGAESSDQPRSSSNKSTASVASSGTTESIDSGVPFSASDSVVPNGTVNGNSIQNAAGNPTEERAIRKPPKKSYAARMDGNNSAASTPNSSIATTQASQAHPAAIYSSTMGPNGPNATEQMRYFGNSSAYISPQELQAQFDLSQQAARNPSSMPPMSIYQPVKAPENPTATPQMLPYGMGMGNMSRNGDTPTNMTLPKKRALSPSILEGNETLTISSLIERTIERATTNPSSMPPMAMPFAVSGNPHGAFGGMMEANFGKQQSDAGAAKKNRRSAKEPKVDPRRATQTATIKDLLAHSNLSPQMQQASVASPVMASGAEMHQGMPGKVPTPKLNMERTTHADSPFSKDRPAQSPKSSQSSTQNSAMNAQRQQMDDRHRHAVEKVQHYLNTGVSSDPVPERAGGALPKSRRKPQEEKNNAPKHVMESSGSGRSPREESAKTNGYVNGSDSHENGFPGAPHDFDNFMMTLSSAGLSAAQQMATGANPSAATALEGFFRMQKDMELLKRKVGELETLKAFYITQIQSLRTLEEKHAHDSVYPIQPTPMSAEVARLLGILAADPNMSEDLSQSTKRSTTESASSDGLMARLHEPAASNPNQRSSRDQSRPESRVQNGPMHGQQQMSTGQAPAQSPSSTPKPPSRSRLPKEEVRERESRDPYAQQNGYPSGQSTGSSSSGQNQRRSQYPGVEHMDGMPSGVISTPAPVVSQPQLLMPNVGAPQFLLQNPQLYSMPMDQRMFSMMPGQFFSPMYQPQLGSFLQSANPADFANLGRMPSGRYQMEENAMGQHHAAMSAHNGALKRDYEMARDN